MPADPDLKSFEALYGNGKPQLVYRWIVADLETPVSAYLKLCEDRENSFLLESVEGGETLGRYSIIGLDPDLIWECRGKAVSINGKAQDADALQSLRATVNTCRIDAIPEDLPPMAASGLFGYMGYDMIRLYEDIPDTNPDIDGIADSVFVRPTTMVIFDNIKHMICLSAPVYPDDRSARDAYDAARSRLNHIERNLRREIPDSALNHKTGLPERLSAESNMSPDEYYEMVRRTIEHIYAGDIFQCVIGQRFTAPFDLPAFELYRALRRINPSPFLFYLNFGGFQLVGSSPEILVRLRDGTVTIRPLAGTRPRGTTSEEDARLAHELLSDPKERAEHLMLLDLGRNDVGRVSETGSMRVTEQFVIEYYSHVMHIVSNVEGALRADLDAIDALFAGFPAGTVSGAPKVRAMEIIDDLEPTRRGYYGGCAGYFSANGDLDACICLRTALVKDGKLHIQASGGIVADSVPETEYQESCNKAQAIIRAAEEALRIARQPDPAKPLKRAS